MPNFLFEFTDTTIRAMLAIIEADTQEEAEKLFDNGDWEARIRQEYIEKRGPRRITQISPETARQVGWKNPPGSARPIRIQQE